MAQILRLLFVLLLLAGVLPAKLRDNLIPGPAGLSRADWAEIRELYEQHRHAAVPVNGEYRARNPRQQWLSRFDGRGFTVSPDEGAWTWGLELRGRGDRAKMSGRGDRVAYDWGDGLEEWFVNGRAGLEHGFTVKGKPAGGLRLAFAVRGGLVARIAKDGRGVWFGEAVRYEELKAWDADGRALEARFEVAGMGLRLEVDDRVARYPVTIDPIAQQAYLKASNTDAGDRFGNAVAVSGETAVVGAPAEDSGATGIDGNQADNSCGFCGAAYVFVRSNGIWRQQAYLKAPVVSLGLGFGTSVGVSGDTVVVGATHSIGTGTAYVFARSGDRWSQEAQLLPLQGDNGDLFGTSVGISGNTIVVGAIGESSGATGINGNESDNSAIVSGAAFVFERRNAAWIRQAYLKASNTEQGDHFGESVAISGDTIVVGAPWEDSSATGVNGNQADNTAPLSGAAYVFTRANGEWSQQAYLKASNTGRSDDFGSAVGISGDTIVVGAALEDSNATGVNGNQSDNSAEEAGAAYVFGRSNGLWAQQAYLKASNTNRYRFFGISVAVSADTVVVCASLDSSSATGVDGSQTDTSASGSGAAYLFRRSNGAWTQQAFLKASNTGAGDAFGRTVAISMDKVVVAAVGEDSNAVGVNGNQADNSAIDSGAAYLFDLDRIFSKPGLFRAGFFWLQDTDGDRMFTTPPDRAFPFGGLPGDIPIAGDWNGDGRTKAGIYRVSHGLFGLFLLDYDGDGSFNPAADRAYNLNIGTQPGDIPVVGDWNGSGTTKVGIFRQGFLWILDTDGNGLFQGTDQAIAFGGLPGDQPVVGDWDGNGTSNLGLFRGGFFWILDVNGNGQLDNVNQPNGDRAFAFGGLPGDVPITGKWTTGDTRSRVGLFRAGFFWVLDANGNATFDGTGPGQDLAFAFGGIAGDKPVAGYW